MTGERGFPVEDFLEAITSQLDRTQDALRLKSVNRPLTYAIRDFSMELKVHVELDADGRVLFSPSTSGDTGASSVHIGFTTVTRTEMNENTVSATSLRSPTLDELGLDQQERRQLERLGVRNAAQLDELKRSTGEAAVSRFSGLPVSRLRQALAQGRPTVRSVRPADPVPGPAGPGPTAPAAADPGPAAPATVRLPSSTRRVRIDGDRLGETTRRALLDQRPLEVRPVDGGVEVDLGTESRDGVLELDLGDDGVLAMALEFGTEPDTNPSVTPPVTPTSDPVAAPGSVLGNGHDPWRSSC